MSATSLLRLILLAAIWGGSFLLMRIASPVIGAIPTAFIRVLTGAAGLGLLILLLRIPLTFHKKLIAALILGAINSGAPFLLFSLAAQVLPAGYSAILNATTPLMGIIIGASFFNEHISSKKICGILIGLAGVAVLTHTGPLQPTTAVLLGVCACLTATLCYALAGFLTQRWITQRGGLDNRLVALGSQIGAVPLLLPFMGWETALHPLEWKTIPPNVWLALLSLGLICTSCAYILYFQLITDIGPLKALSVTFLIPLFGVFWGWLVLGETVTLAHAVGGSLIATALWLVLRQSTTPLHNKKTHEHKL